MPKTVGGEREQRGGGGGRGGRVVNSLKTWEKREGSLQLQLP